MPFPKSPLMCAPGASANALALIGEISRIEKEPIQGDYILDKPVWALYIGTIRKELTMSLDNPIFKDEEKARQYLESLRWPDGPVCPHCGNCDGNYDFHGKAHRPGLHKCAAAACGKQFSVTVGTLFERSHVPLHKWLLAVHLLCASKKGHSSHQIHRMLGVTYKTAWFMTHRIREAMKDPVFSSKLGGSGRIVEVDETFWGDTKMYRKAPRGGFQHKEKIFSLVERHGKVRSFHVESVGAATLKPIIREQVHSDTSLMTDDWGGYKGIGKDFESHEAVVHSRKEYVRGRIHTNTIEGYFSILKRGLRGVYQHVGKRHLRRYVGEFDFRYNNRDISDDERTAVALKGIEGKRLLYTRF
jgi:transposase-like protein